MLAVGGGYWAVELGDLELLWAQHCLGSLCAAGGGPSFPSSSQNELIVG